MDLKVIFLCCLFLSVLAENRRSNKPIIDIQYAEPHILGAASRSDRHPGINSRTVYYPSIPIASEDEYYHYGIQDPAEHNMFDSSASFIDNNLGSEMRQGDSSYGYISGYSMVSTRKYS